MRIALGENARMALDTLRENKVRSFLTVLGVVIGITALITVASILVGFYSDVTAYLDDYGPNTIWIFRIKLVEVFNGEKLKILCNFTLNEADSNDITSWIGR